MIGRLWQVAVMVLALTFTSCSARPTPVPAATPAVTPAPAAGKQPRGGTVRASGKVVPAQKAELSFPTTGRVLAMAAGEGDSVQAGALLVALDKAAAEATVMQARAVLSRAQASVAELKAGPRPQQIAAAQARVEAAQARTAQLAEGARMEEIAAAQAELAAAQAALQQLFSGPRQEEQITAATALSNAEAVLHQAQAAYDRVSSRSDIGMLPESLKLQEATNNYEAAQARYAALHATPNPDITAAARARIQQTQAVLDRLLNPATQGQIAEAEAQLHAAQADLELLKAGARSETIAAAAADLSGAEAALKRAEADLANAELHAPFAGTVTARKVNAGEMVLPGQAVVTLADLSRLRIETTDLSERDVARVAIGQPVTVFVDALGAEIPGRVTRIASQATVVGGDAVYAVTIDLDHQPEGLRWGMSATVDITG